MEAYFLIFGFVSLSHIEEERRQIFIKVLVFLQGMSLLGKLKFWHKEDDLDFDSLADKEMGKMPTDFGTDHASSGTEEKSFFPQEPEAEPLSSPSFQPSPSRSSSSSFTSPQSANRDLELINSKLDTLKAILNSMDQRLAHVEQTSGVEKKNQRLW